MSASPAPPPSPNQDVVIGWIVDKEGSFGYRSLTFPVLRHLLDFEPDAPPCAIISAELDDRPAGLLVACLDPMSREAEILSIVTAPSMRRRGVAKALMAAAAPALVELGAESASLKFPEDSPSRAALDRLIARHGFSAPRVRSRQYELSASKTIDARWIRERRLPRGYEVVLWKDLPADIVKLVETEDASLNWVTPYLHPSLFTEGFEPRTSFAMLVDGELRAWTLNHLLGDVLRFSCAFAHPEQQRGAWITVLFRRSTLEMLKLGLDRTSYTIDVSEPRFFEFAERYMRPGALRVAAFLEADKKLGG